ncbi:peptide-methionine (R)-S-oxide reductase MsrB [Methanomethylophilus alvi]|uniref:peptide-methionine (R)-S-oxide reductase MsrB n=1 Tax=Methanomethylophilus alvi TaxID=1291540 RepID=UPI0037DD83D9
MKEIWFAGGCFWGTERLMSAIPGVVSTEVGYANGDPSLDPSYEEVCRRTTGYRETVHVLYDPAEVSTDYLVYAFYSSIDPSMENGQGNDRGPQYQACIFWRDPETEDTVRRISAVEAMRYRPFCVVLEELKVFRRAEEYHQRYLEKNEHGYCHVDPYLIKQVSDRVFDPSAYKRPSDEEISESLSGSEIYITQNGGTEPPFDNEYDSEFGRGIFVDKVTGEPLFLSQDKYNSHCGWPAFSRPLDPNAMVYLEDRSLPITRIEVRSRVGNTHLGHVFYGDSWSPTRARYCMNSASLRFIPVEDMETEGYGHLVHLVGEKKEMWRSPFSDDVGRI